MTSYSAGRGGPLTLILNPNARGPRVHPSCLEKVRSKLGQGVEVHLTRSLADLDLLMQELSFSGRTVCFFGGDGSIARGLTALIRRGGYGSNDAPLPPVLAVPAGTINMLCSEIGLRGSVSAIFDQWHEGGLDVVREVPLLRIEVGPQGQSEVFYGFAMAWGIGYRVLTRYYGRANQAPSVLDGLAAFTEAFWAAVHPNADDHPLFRAFDLSLQLNSTPVDVSELRSLTIGTIQRLSLGMRPFVREPLKNKQFYATAHGLRLRQIVRHLPTLLFGQGQLRSLNYPGKLVVGTETQSLECILSEGFTLDGEMFELREPTRVHVSTGPNVRFWTRKA